MPEAKCPYFSSVNPFIPKGSCFVLREKVATWPSNVGAVQLLFALYVKPAGRGKAVLEDGTDAHGMDSVVQEMWLYPLCLPHDRGTHSCLCERCSPWLCSSSHSGIWAWVLGHLSCVPPGAGGMAGITHCSQTVEQTCFRHWSHAGCHQGFRVSLHPFAATAKRRGSDPVNRTK